MQDPVLFKGFFFPSPRCDQPTVKEYSLYLFQEKQRAHRVDAHLS